MHTRANARLMQKDRLRFVSQDLNDHRPLAERGQLVDVPPPQLIGSVRTPPGNRSGLLRRADQTTPLNLLVLMEQPVGTVKSQVLALLGQVRHDLRRWQRGHPSTSVNLSEAFQPPGPQGLYDASTTSPSTRQLLRQA